MWFRNPVFSGHQQTDADVYEEGNRVRSFLEQEQFGGLMVSDVKTYQEAILLKEIQWCWKLIKILRGGVQCMLMRSLVN